MKKLTLLFVVACTVCSTAFAQTDLKVKDLFIPSSPGLVLADKAPASIEKPVTPKTFGVSLLNLLQGGAVEATPFWFTSKPMFTYDEWIRKKFTLLETFNISAATFKEDSATAVSGGFRTQVLRIYSKSYIKKLEAQEQAIVDVLTVDAKIDSNGNLIIDLKKLQAEKEKLQQLEKKGMFALEIAGAVIGSGKANSFKELQSQKSGVWANMRWSPESSALDFVGLARYSWADHTVKDSAFFDYGLSLNYAEKNLNIALEYVNRRDFAARKNYDRLNFSAVYQLNDNLAIVAALGKNFNKSNDIITVFGLNIGISNQQLK